MPSPLPSPPWTHTWGRNLAAIAGAAFPVALLLAVSLPNWNAARTPSIAAAWLSLWLACTVGYVLLLVDPHLPEDEPCLRSGSFLGLHWFEFASRPGLRSWTRNAATARRIRALPAQDVVRGGLDTVYEQPLGERPFKHIAAGMQVVAAVLAGLAVPLVPAVLVSPLGGPYGMIWAFLSVGLMTGSVVLGFIVPFAIAHQLWNTVGHPRQVGRVTIHRAQLQTAQGSFALEPDTTTDLLHTPYGARLELHNAHDHCVLHGDHAVLASVARHLRDGGGPPRQPEPLPWWVTHLRARWTIEGSTAP